MPASMISAETGGSTKVAGSSIEIVAIGPMPGSTPISVPRSTPMKQSMMLFSESATPKPSARFCRSSMVSSSASAEADCALERFDVGAQRDRQLQSRHEDQGAEDGEEDTEDQARLPAEALGVADSRDDHQQDPGDQHPNRLQDQAEHHDRSQNPQDRPPVVLG